MNQHKCFRRILVSAVVMLQMMQLQAKVTAPPRTKGAALVVVHPGEPKKLKKSLDSIHPTQNMKDVNKDDSSNDTSDASDHMGTANIADIPALPPDTIAQKE